MKKLLMYLFALLVVASCAHKDLCYDHSHTVDVEVFSTGGMLLMPPLHPCRFTCFRQAAERLCAMISRIGEEVRFGCPSDITTHFA